MSDVIDRLTSRKFLLVLAFCIYTFIQASGGAISQAEASDAILKAIGAFLGAEGLADALGRYKPDVRTDPAPTPAEAEASASTGSGTTVPGSIH